MTTMNLSSRGRTLCLLLCLLGRTAEAQDNTTNTTTLPAGPNYRATYKGRFQSYMDGCEGPPPVVQVACSSTLNLLNISHQAIVCTPTPPDNLPTGFSDGVTCTSACTTSACEQEAYMNDGTFTTEEGPWGEIIYECEGHTVAEVDTLLLYQGSEDGTCSWRWFFDNAIYHLAQLGIQCPRDQSELEDDVFDLNDTTVPSADNSTTEIGWNSLLESLEDAVVSRANEQDTFVYDDLWTECSRGDSVAVEFASPDGSNRLVCAVGQNCGGEDCTVPLRTIQVHADVSKFASQCVETLRDDVPEASLLISEDSKSSSDLSNGDYTIRFQAGWSFLMKNPEYWYDNDDIDCFVGYADAVSVACENGVLEFVEASQDKIDCTERDDGMFCTVPWAWGEGRDMNSFYTVTYDCTASNQLPTTSLTIEPNNMTCMEDIFDDLVVGHALQIGHFCNDTTDGEYRYQDYDYECGPDEQYLLLDAETQALGDRFTCLRTVPIRDLHYIADIPGVTMTTDWRTDQEGETLDPLCYGFQDAINITESDMEEEIPMVNLTNTTNSTIMP